MVSLLQTIRPLEQAIASCARSFKGGPGIPAIHDGCSDLPRSRGCRSVAGSMPSRAGRVGTLRLVQLFSSCRKCAGRGSSAHRTRPWPQCRSPAGMIGRSLRPQIRVLHERSGVVTAGDQFRRPLGLSCWMADGPTPRSRDMALKTHNTA